jgi:DNA-binding ferritin-like protein (Dps family)
MYAGPGGDGANAASMFEDLLDLFEQSAANRTAIREIVGEDPVEFLEAFVRNYPDGNWRTRERDRLISAIERAAGENTEQEERAD